MTKSAKAKSKYPAGFDEYGRWNGVTEEEFDAFLQDVRRERQLKEWQQLLEKWKPLGAPPDPCSSPPVWPSTTIPATAGMVPFFTAALPHSANPAPARPRRGLSSSIPTGSKTMTDRIEQARLAGLAAIARRNEAGHAPIPDVDDLPGMRASGSLPRSLARWGSGMGRVGPIREVRDGWSR